MKRLAVLLALVLAPAAHAAVVTGTAADPVGDAPARGVDLVSAAWTFDDAAGTFSVTVTFSAAPDAENWGAINAQLRPGCDGIAFATLRGNSRTSGSSSGTAGTYDDGVQPDGSTGPSLVPGTNVKSDGGRTTTMEITHPRLVGRTAGCVTISVTHNATLDTVTVPMKTTTGTPTPPPPPSTGTPYDVPRPPAATAKASDVRLGSGRRLTFKKYRARVGLSGTAAGMAVRLSLRLRSGTTIATGRYVARVTQPALVTLTMTTRGRAYLRRHRRFKATLRLRTTLATTTFERRYAVTVVRR